MPVREVNPLPFGKQFRPDEIIGHSMLSPAKSFAGQHVVEGIATVIAMEAAASFIPKG